MKRKKEKRKEGEIPSRSDHPHHHEASRSQKPSTPSYSSGLFPVCFRNRERGTSTPPPSLGWTSQRLCATAQRQRCVSLLVEGRALERRGGRYYAELLVARCARSGLAEPRAHCRGAVLGSCEEVHWTTLLPPPCGGGGARALFASQPRGASSSAGGLDPYRPTPREEEEPCHVDWPTPPTPTAAGCCFQRHARH